MLGHGISSSKVKEEGILAIKKIASKKTDRTITTGIAKKLNRTKQEQKKDP